MNQDHVSVPRPAYLNERGPETDVLKLLDKLEDLADGAIEFWHRAWGLSLDEFHMLTNKIRASLPDEVRRASRVAGDSDRIVSAARDEGQMILQQAREEAERILEEAKTEQRRLTDESEIVRMATAQAKEIVASAEGSARSIRRGADEYAAEVLSAVENHLGRLLGTIQRGREKLEQRVESAPVEETLTVTRDRTGLIRR
jgi:vacuolar-type H+-ATPase subunit H